MVTSFLDSATFLQTASPTMDSSKPTDNIEKEAPRQLNAVLHDVKTRINNVPSGDMTEFLEHQLKSYLPCGKHFAVWLSRTHKTIHV